MKGGEGMALVKCPECGREVSNKAVSCPGCGCPIADFKVKNSIDTLLDELYNKYPNEMVKAIKELREVTGMDLKSARDAVYIRYKGKTARQLEADEKAVRKAKSKQASNNIWNSLQGLSNSLSKDKTVRCPKCGSTSISYTNKKLSLGRAVVGDAVAGPAGAVIGGLSSKKGYAVCLKCGKQWKI